MPYASNQTQCDYFLFSLFGNAYGCVMGAGCWLLGVMLLLRLLPLQMSTIFSIAMGTRAFNRLDSLHPPLFIFRLYKRLNTYVYCSNCCCCCFLVMVMLLLLMPNSWCVHTIFHFYSNTHSYMASSIWHLYGVCRSPKNSQSSLFLFFAGFLLRSFCALLPKKRDILLAIALRLNLFRYCLSYAHADGDTDAWCLMSKSILIRLRLLLFPFSLALSPHVHVVIETQLHAKYFPLISAFTVSILPLQRCFIAFRRSLPSFLWSPFLYISLFCFQEKRCYSFVVVVCCLT